MKESLRAGVSLVNRVQVDRDRTIGFMGEEGRVYGTPYLVRDIEMTCRQLILDHGDAGEDSVGTDVSIKHLAPTLLGMTAEITATVQRGGRAQDHLRGRGQGRSRPDLQRDARPFRGRCRQDRGAPEGQGRQGRRRQSEIIAAGSPGKPIKQARGRGCAPFA